ncbi:MAG: dihydropteridine reductase [Clostridia bacterium]|nr:dihydropteridine reductase [Clostridia bacterium]
MERNNHSNNFHYTYSAPTQEERREINSIRKQYGTQEKENKIEILRKLDARVKTPALIISLVLGIGGILLFGLGLAMIMEWELFLFGIIVSVVGAIPVGLAYPVHNYLLKRSKKKYGEEILRLSEELLQETTEEF